MNTFAGNFSKKITKLEKNLHLFEFIKLFFLSENKLSKILKKAKKVFSDKIFLFIYLYLIFFALEFALKISSIIGNKLFIPPKTFMSFQIFL